MSTEIKEKVGTIVLAMSKLQPNYSREATIELSQAVDPMVEQFDGYYGRKMVFSSKEPDLMADIVFYKDLKSFNEAAEIELKSETCQKYFAAMIMDGPAYKMVVASPKLMSPMKPGKAGVVELVLFKPKPGYSNDEIQAAAGKLEPILESYEGYIGRKLALSDDGLWMDLLYWTDMENAEKASNQIVNNSIAQEVFALIDESTMTLQHFDVVIDTEK